jgi:hypothetical protein
VFDWEKITPQFAAVWATPAPFVVALLIAAGLIWLILDWRYRAIMANRDSEISLIKGQRDDYKEKLGGATPDQAKARVDALEMRLAMIEPRRLSREQKTQMLADLQSAPSFISINADMACADCAVFAADFQEVAERASWKVDMARVMADALASPKGLVVITIDAKRPSSAAAALVAALRRLNISHDVESRAMQSFPGQETPDAELLITTRAST